MNMKITILSFLAVILITINGSAQKHLKTNQKLLISAVPGLGSFKAGYSYSPITVNGKKINIQQLDGTLTMPVINRMKGGKLDFLLAGVSYSGLQLSGTGTQFGGTKFHSISVPLTFQKALSPKYAILASFIPTLSSDLKDVSREDMIYSGAVMLKVRVSDNFNYSVGAAYSKQFFGSVIIPVVGIDWNITDKLSFSGTLPVSEKIKYQLSDKSAFGVNLDLGIGGGSYRLSEKMNSDYLQVQQFNGTLFYEYAISKKFVIGVSAGYNFTQKISQYATDQKVDWVPFNNLDDRGAPSAELNKTGVVVRTGISYQF